METFEHQTKGLEPSLEKTKFRKNITLLLFLDDRRTLLGYDKFI